MDYILDGEQLFSKYEKAIKKARAKQNFLEVSSTPSSFLLSSLKALYAAFSVM